MLLMGPLGTNFSEISNKNENIFIEENTFENVVCEMLLISSGLSVLSTMIGRRKR